MGNMIQALKHLNACEDHMHIKTAACSIGVIPSMDPLLLGTDMTNY